MRQYPLLFTKNKRSFKNKSKLRLKTHMNAIQLSCLTLAFAILAVTFPIPSWTTNGPGQCYNRNWCHLIYVVHFTGRSYNVLWFSIPVLYVFLLLFLCYIIFSTSVLNQVFENVWLIFHNCELKQRSKGRVLALCQTVQSWKKKKKTRIWWFHEISTQYMTTRQLFRKG